MHRCHSWRASSLAIATLGLVSVLAGCDDKITPTNVVVIPTPTGFTEHKLVADISTMGAPTVDPSLVNPWGIAFGSTGILWVANNGTGTSTTYDAQGAKQALTVTIPTATTPTGGVPTGVIFNSTTSFAIGSTGAAAFIFAGEDGTISAWNSAAASAAQLVADRSATGAVYKGIAMAPLGGQNFLYATNFSQNEIDVFDTNFGFMGSFNDGTIPAGFAPFGIQNINGQLYVTYAKQLAPDNKDDVAGVGNGFVDIFNPDGTLIRRFVSNGTLNSPWGVALAPAGFGSVSGAILVGNFGDGLITAYDAQTGASLGTLSDPTGATIVIDGLWGLAFGPTASTPTLYFSSGPNGETHGLVGTITP